MTVAGGTVRVDDGRLRLNAASVPLRGHRFALDYGALVLAWPGALVQPLLRNDESGTPTAVMDFGPVQLLQLDCAGGEVDVGYHGLMRLAFTTTRGGFDRPYIFDGIGGRFVITMAGLTNSGLIDGTYTQEAWAMYKPARPGILSITLTCPKPFTLSFASNSQTPSPIDDGTDGALEVSVPTLVRVGTDHTGEVLLAFRFTPTTLPLDADLVEASIDHTPANLTVSATNLRPGESLSARIDDAGAAVATLTADETGVLNGASVPLDNLNAGVHRLVLTSTSGAATSLQFSVAASPLPIPTVPVADVAPEWDPPEVPVQRWSWIDNYTDAHGVRRGLGTWVMPANPDKMSSPHAPKGLSFLHTTAPDGVTHMYQGGNKSFEWTFSGIVLDKATHDTLRAYYALNRRFYIVDHRLRRWTVTVAKLDLVPRRVPGNDWAFDYSVTALIYSGPVWMHP